MTINQLRPSYKDYLWGGQKLKENYGKKTDLNPLAESWEVSTHPDGPSYILGGPHDGLTLKAYLEEKNQAPLGTKGQTFDRFPVLVKFIDALGELSIQVHPNDEYGFKHENEYGKTEMWYILEAEPGAKVYYGTKEPISKEAFKQSIEDQTVLDKLNHVAVKKGDVIFVEAGTIHAIGKGIVLCEVQQNSNTTYRVYDYHRKDAEGNLRDLHIDKALDVATLTPLNTDFEPAEVAKTYENHTKQLLASSSYFNVQKVEVGGSFTQSISKESFKSITVIEGSITFEDNNHSLTLNKGESAFIDAGSQHIKTDGPGTYLSVSV
ncbi:type I phosphomannose isomerase catalytic subunit [Facklamia miroungae]|uniref:Mannose-6-phosphate isomerase n=1 Tax=Facklamia miroungae TaxID=120956 RepID=A0A1G7U9E1_9LACT|nr:type I phosphomannose isomerase catalytic subunit [Facklamia miroungae]NKZ30018.1 class I mannose-6-phosphate isomerase [Facklamia miroungae]SDG44222.1 mannose-6-phosphate isomerase [Facklamia miroungae]